MIGFNIDLVNVETIARKELRDAARNRWFVLFTAAFAGLALALSLFAQPTSSFTTQLAGYYSRTAASLINLVLLFVPLLGLTLGASNLVGDHERGVLGYLLAQPVTRSEVLLGKYVGMAAALWASLSLGFGGAGVVLALRGQIRDAGGYVITVILAFLLALAMLSLGFLVSTLARKTSTALGGALFLWLLLVFVGDLGVMGTALVMQVPISTVFLLAVLNPLQLFKMASILTIQANLEVLGPAGLYATKQFGSTLTWFLIGGLLVWTVIPFAGALVQFSRGERMPARRAIPARSAALLVVAILFLAGCAQPTPQPAAAPDIKIDVKVEPDPPAVGEGVLIVKLNNADGTPINDAQITVHGDMEHAGMESVEGNGGKASNGEYRVPFNWTMGGGWKVAVTASLPDSRGTIQKSFDFFVGAVSQKSIINRTEQANPPNQSATPGR